MVNIFDEAKEKTVPSWAKFATDGDSYQGTYVGKITGQKDGYGNEQIIYQLLQEDDSIINVGFGLNKKVIHKDLAEVNFGQILGIRYKGTVTIKDRHTGKPLEVKDFALHYDPKIVNAKWLEENKDNMPEVTVAEPVEQSASLNVFDTPEKKEEVKVVEEVGAVVEDIPFSSEKSLTNADKLKAIEQLATEKLGKFTGTTKEKVMQATGVAFIPLQYDKILEKLAAMDF